jgi:hypothetical protein
VTGGFANLAFVDISPPSILAVAPALKGVVAAASSSQDSRPLWMAIRDITFTLLRRQCDVHHLDVDLRKSDIQCLDWPFDCAKGVN